MKDAHVGHKICVFITHNAGIQLIHDLVTEKFSNALGKLNLHSRQENLMFYLQETKKNL